MFRLMDGLVRVGAQVTGSLSRSLTSPHMTVSLHDEARPGAWRGGTPALGRTCSLIDTELDAGDEDGSSAGEGLRRGGFLTQSVTMRVPRGRALEWGASALGESGLGSKNVRALLGAECACVISWDPAMESGACTLDNHTT